MTHYSLEVLTVVFMEDITQLSRPEFFCENLKSITKMIKKEISVGSVTAKEYSFLLVHI